MSANLLSPRQSRTRLPSSAITSNPGQEGLVTSVVAGKQNATAHRPPTVSVPIVCRIISPAPICAPICVSCYLSMSLISLQRSLSPKRSTKSVRPPHSYLLDSGLRHSLAPQLCLWPRRPSGEDAGTTQESAYHTNILTPRPSEPDRPVTQLRPEVDFTQHLGPPIVRDSWKSDTEPSPSAPKPVVKKGNHHPTSLNPLDHSLKAQRKSQPEDLLSSDDEAPPFECAKRKLNTPEHSDDEIDKDDGEIGLDQGTRLYGKSADIHLVGPTVFWKYLHIKEVTPPDPQPEAYPPDPGTFPKVRRPMYWGPPFPVNNHPSILPYVNLIPINPQVGTRMGRRPFENSHLLSFRPR